MSSRPTGRTRKPKNPKSCHERALGLLAVRPRSRREIETRLLQAGFGQDEVDEVLASLERAGLIDDTQFALDLAEHAFNNKGSGVRAVASALRAKGVDISTVEAVTAGFAEHEEERARELAERRATRMRGLDRATAHRRLTDFLIRRGHSPSTARDAAARALAVEAELD